MHIRILFGLCFISEAPGGGLTKAVFQQLEEMSLPVGNFRGQGYKNRCNMKGKENRVQQRIPCVNRRNFFVFLQCTFFKFGKSATAICCWEAPDFFDLLQPVCVCVISQLQHICGNN
jgi:hypothetical protein